MTEDAHGLTVPEDTSLHPRPEWQWLFGGNPAAIEAQEAAGGRELLGSQVQVLPRDHGDDGPWLALGFTFGAVVDDLFQAATLPDGWTKQAGQDDPRGFYLVDERGLVRASVFYKAAFYDRKAGMHLIDVGNHYVTHAIYGDGPVSGPWAKLTDAERADALVRVGEYLADAEQYPDIYGKRVDRAQAVLAQIDALGATP